MPRRLALDTYLLTERVVRQSCFVNENTLLAAYRAGDPRRRQAALGIKRPGRYGVHRFKTVLEAMTDSIVPHFHNDLGVPVIDIGAREFMCVGALPPFDHPHVFCDMGDDAEYICPYCSTLYRHDPTLAPNAARPAECRLPDTYV
jgi:uncharacterized Zn-finger protein